MTEPAPLARKIGMKPGHIVHLRHRPAGWVVPDAPAGCAIAEGDPAGADMTIAFYRELSRLRSEASDLAAELDDHAMLWIAWPRRAAGHRSDITDTLARDLLLSTGLVDVKVAALGADWSGLKFVRRVEHRR
ncbi:DUF3052 domain-containing protein [Nocardia aurantia]|uniref:DUF3052 domain-containing protein n=1 Tax=Nocardia aurantia TaxID=2585199 RepID=A0A7K0E229_9NOCA|nr:DUF3052 domain-containing protein [Nocardia aurantia]MQY31214.1 hypothetical protein [Nocardia aurantia]